MKCVLCVASGNEMCAVCCRWWSMALKAALAGTTWCTMLAGTQGESCLVLQNQLGVSTHGTSLFQDKWLVAPSTCPDEANLLSKKNNVLQMQQ